MSNRGLCFVTVLSLTLTSA